VEEPNPLRTTLKCVVVCWNSDTLVAIVLRRSVPDLNETRLPRKLRGKPDRSLLAARGLLRALGLR
jgi:hypothetical protein